MEFYAEADWWDVSTASDWLRKYVVPHLRGPLVSKGAMAHKFAEFCGGRPQFWGYYCAHDWFLVCALYGGLMKLPLSWPFWCNDIQTARTIGGTLGEPNVVNNQEHDALADARWTKQMYEHFVLSDRGRSPTRR